MSGVPTPRWDGRSVTTGQCPAGMGTLCPPMASESQKFLCLKERREGRETQVTATLCFRHHPLLWPAHSTLQDRAAGRTQAPSLGESVCPIFPRDLQESPVSPSSTRQRTLITKGQNHVAPYHRQPYQHPHFPPLPQGRQQAQAVSSPILQRNRLRLGTGHDPAGGMWGAGI